MSFWRYPLSAGLKNEKKDGRLQELYPVQAAVESMLGSFIGPGWARQRPHRRG